MDIVSNELGKVVITNEVITRIAGVSATECYGVVGMVSQNKIKDGVIELLKKENAAKGVVMREDNGIHIDLFVTVLYGVKISEISHNIQSKVAYDLENVGIKVVSVNVSIEDVSIEN